MGLVWQSYNSGEGLHGFGFTGSFPRERTTQQYPARQTIKGIEHGPSGQGERGSGRKRETDGRRSGGKNRNSMGENTILYYVPCTNGHGISLPSGVAHSRFFSRRNNRPTISSTANNTGNQILAARTGRARWREDEGKGGRGRGGEDEERRLEEESAILYYMPCANGHGISLPRGVAHSRFFSRRNNHPTISSAANNTRNQIRAARTGRARWREDEGEGGRGRGGREGRTATRGGKCDLVLHALCKRAWNISSAWGSPLEILFREKQPPNNIQHGEQ